MTFLVIHERGNWSAIRLAKTIEEAKKELLKMVQEATVDRRNPHRSRRALLTHRACKRVEVCRLEGGRGKA
jgi:hypothetical protein